MFDKLQLTTGYNKKIPVINTPTKKEDKKSITSMMKYKKGFKSKYPSNQK